MFLFQFLFFLDAVTMLNFQILKRITSSETWSNYVVTFFFLENAKNLGRSDEDGLTFYLRKLASESQK